MTTANVHANETVPAVSVIMPAYDVARYIGQAIDSILAQTFTDYEIIVVNDGSPDTNELESVLEPYRQKITYIKQQNGGVSAARNTAIHTAKGRYLALLDPDDFWEPEYLAVQVAALESDPTIDVFYPNALLFGDACNAGKSYMDICRSEGEVTFESLITERCQVPIFVTARTQVIKRVGMFDESLRISQDFDLWLRIVKSGGRIAYTRRVLVHRRRRADGLSSNEIALWKDILLIFDKAARIFSLTPAEREALERERPKCRAMFDLYQGKQAFLEGDAKTAINCLTAANACLRSRKLAFVIAALRAAPRLLLGIHRVRQRFLSMRTRALPVPSPLLQSEARGGNV
jgi:glycosyltransferase involved in cell wall biosynthesis